MQLKGDVCYFSSDTDDTRYPPSPKSCQLCFIIAPKSQLLHSSARAIGLAPRCTQRYCKTKGEANGFGMPDVQVSIGFRWEPRVDLLVFLAFEIIEDNLFNEVDRIGWVSVFVFHGPLG